MKATGCGPQKENGFTAIANELMEQFAIVSLRGQQFRCLMFLLRRTYGYGKKEDRISLSQWAAGTKIERHNVWRELQLLIKQNVIYCVSNGPKRPMTWGFNKHYNSWECSPVVTEDYETVVTEDYRTQETVVTGDYETVVTPHESTKERKKAEAETAAANEKKNQTPPSLPLDPLFGAFVEDYQHFWGLMVSTDAMSQDILDWTVRVTRAGWQYALKEAADHNARNWRYLNSILNRIEREGYLAPVPVTCATTNFSMEDLL